MPGCCNVTVNWDVLSSLCAVSAPFPANIHFQTTVPKKNFIPVDNSSYQYICTFVQLFNQPSREEWGMQTDLTELRPELLMLYEVEDENIKIPTVWNKPGGCISKTSEIKNNLNTIVMTLSGRITMVKINKIRTARPCDFSYLEEVKDDKYKHKYLGNLIELIVEGFPGRKEHEKILIENLKDLIP